jgi:hypothetical protein
VDCNQLAVDIDNEIVVVYNFLRDRYKTKFPELESLVHSPLDYARVVQVGALGRAGQAASGCRQTCWHLAAACAGHGRRSPTLPLLHGALPAWCAPLPLTH